MDTFFLCAVCGSQNEIWVDESQGEEQEFIQDCQICCHPNVLRAYPNGEGGYEVEASFEE